MLRLFRKLVAAACCFGAALCLNPTSGFAQMTVSASSWGQVWSDGNANGCCYLLGYQNGYKDDAWAVFNLSAVSGTYLYAELNIFEPAFGFGVTVPSATVQAGGYTGTVGQLYSAAGFDAIDSGTPFGSISTTVSDDGTTLHIVLNSAGIAAITAAEGSGQFVVGLSTTNLTLEDGNNDYLFGGSQYTGAISLTLSDTPIPEPASIAILGVATAGLVKLRHRQARRSAA